ncbi:MAG: DNA-3-methyladenine glycosylase 2 family protein [Cyanothece sp. SIO2G6]|nr:DNA-3-methyladenine glycosylase 2 family protein [Cyanothece sp. SIO2G6]
MPSTPDTNPPLTRATLLEGITELSQRDADLGAIATTYGIPPLWDREPGFPTLIHIILEQQVSLSSAKAAFERLCQVAQPLTPQTLLQLSDEELKTIGFSRQKARYGRALAQAILTGQLDLETLPTLSDAAAIADLIQIKGIGPWTANIYLLMVLGRPDSWPSGDLALQLAIQRLKNLAHRPTADEVETWGETWRPWRAVAARLLWQFYLNAPKSPSARSVSAVER